MSEPCPLSADSVSVIDSCPLNLSEWNQRVLQKNCSMYPKKTCFKPLEYHCLLNPYGNESLEVCAPNTWLAEGEYGLEVLEIRLSSLAIIQNMQEYFMLI